jgi:hypothetical protein
MNKTFSVMKVSIGAEMGDTGSAFATLVGRFINRRYFQILRTINWKKINPSYSFATVVGTQDYSLPQDFGKEIGCLDATNGVALKPYDLDELYRFYGDVINDAGNIERYSIYEDAVKTQPSAASVLAISSSSASDTTPTILIRGISSGVEITETVTLTGTSPANTTHQYTQVKGISKNGVTAGTVTVTSNSGAVTVTVLSPEILESRFKIIKLHYAPAAVITVSLPYIVKPLPLSDDYDYPIIDCSDAIELGALADAWRYKRMFGKAQTMEVMFNQEVSALIFDNENQPNRVFQFRPSAFDPNDLY